MFTADDVPIDLVGEGKARVVGVRVTVDPDGTTRNCEAETSSGVPKLDAYTCVIILKRAHFRPAIGASGSPEIGVYRKQVTWAVDSDSLPIIPDIDLTVSRLPAGVKDPTSVDLMFEVDESGHPSSCAAEQPAPVPHPGSASELVGVACDQLLKTYIAKPAMDRQGRPAPSLQDAVVRFSTKPRG